LLRLETSYHLSFFDPSPHRQQVGLSDSPVKRESDYTEIVSSIFVKFRFVSHKAGE